MQAYISNLLPRLKSFSESLDKKELFVEKPWVLFDKTENKSQYIFNRDGRLLISVNGFGHEGKWEHIKGANTLWVEIDGKKYMLKQGFIDPSVMILNLDSSENDIWIFANENLINENKIDKYLKNLVYKKDLIAHFELEDGNTLEIIGALGMDNLVDFPAKINGNNIDKGEFISKNGNKYIVEEKRIKKILYKKTYTINNTKFNFYCDKFYYIGKGDEILNNTTLSDNITYRVVETDQIIKIKNNIVIHETNGDYKYIYAIILIILFSFAVFLIYKLLE